LAEILNVVDRPPGVFPVMQKIISHPDDPALEAKFYEQGAVRTHVRSNQ
jgi:hypothetical protein